MPQGSVASGAPLRRARPSREATGSAGNGTLPGRRRVSGYLLVVLLLLAWELSARLGIVRSENWPPVTQALAVAGTEIRHE